MPSLLSILVVDDEAAMCAMLVDELRQRGYRATSSASVEEAFELLESATFDVILSDIRMRGKDGFELLRAVRESGRRISVVLMTSFGDEDTERRARSEGAVAFLRKPFDPQELLEALQRIAASRPAARQASTREGDELS